MSQSQNLTELSQRIGSEFKNYLPISGGQISGALIMNNQHIQGANYVYAKQVNIGSSIASSSAATEILIKQNG